MTRTIRHIGATAVALLALAVLSACSPSSSVRGGQPTAVASSTPAASSSAGSIAATPTIVTTIGWVGDTTPGSKYGLAPDQGRALFEKTRSYLRRPDIMVGNLEGSFGIGGTPKKSTDAMFIYQAPPAYARSLAWAGFDVMNLANNHTHDYLDPGLAATRKALRAANVAYTGLSGQITVVTRRGVRVAFIGAAPYWWAQSLKNIDDTAWLVTQARKQADVVIVIMHAGAEGSDKEHTPQGAEFAYGENRGSARKFAHAMIDAGASAVLGSGPHVLRGIERYNGGLIAYSLGNFAGWNNFSTAGDLGLSGLLTLRVDNHGRVLGGNLLPLRIDDSGVPGLDAAGASLALVRKLSAADFKTPWPMSASGKLQPAE